MLKVLDWQENNFNELIKKNKEHHYANIAEFYKAEKQIWLIIIEEKLIRFDRTKRAKH